MDEPRSCRTEMTRLAPVVALALIAVSIAAQPAAAQATTTASLSGVVTDTTKAALPGASVTVRHLDTAQDRVVITDGAGRYRAEGLEPGRYKITVELSGF